MTTDKYWSRVKNGLCTWCGQPAQPNTSTCQKHKARNREYSRARNQNKRRYTRAISYGKN